MIRLNEYLSAKKINKEALEKSTKFEYVTGVSVYRMIINDFGVDLHSKESIDYELKYMRTFIQEIRCSQKMTEKAFCNLFKYYADTKVDVCIRQMPGYIQIEFSLDYIDLCYKYDENTKNTFNYVVDIMKNYTK